MEIISARAFISMGLNSNEFKKLHDSFEIIWVTTTPQNQILVLEKLAKTKNKIILEKPIVTNMKEIITLEKSIRDSHCKFYLSQPWTFSDLWGEMKRILLSVEGKLVIQASRGGTLVRRGYPPEVDWAPHDLYLLVDYIKRLGIENTDIHLVSKLVKENLVLLKYSSGKELEFNITAGFMSERKALWEIYSREKLILCLNFQTLEITDCRESESKVLNFGSDNPIIKMINAISEMDSSEDWDLVFKLYFDLVKVG